MFSNSTKYAIRAIVHMLQHQDKGKNTVVEMATELRIPQPYLSKVLQQLSKNGIISSTKGRGGGFYLSNQNMNRPLIDVVICIEGHNVFNKCILGLQNVQMRILVFCILSLRLLKVVSNNQSVIRQWRIYSKYLSKRGTYYKIQLDTC